MLRKLACSAIRFFFTRWTGVRYPYPSNGEDAQSWYSSPMVAFPSLATSLRAQALYAFRFARIRYRDLIALAKQLGLAANVPFKLLCHEVAQHVFEEHIIKCNPTDSDEEAGIAEEFLHHETLKNTSFFWLDNVCSYFRRVNFVYLHYRRRHFMRKRRLPTVSELSAEQARCITSLMANDPLSIDAFAFIINSSLLGLQVRDICLPVVESLWKQQSDAGRYGDQCEEAWKLLSLFGGKKKQLEIASRILDIPMEWFRGFDYRVPAEQLPMTRLKIIADAVSDVTTIEDAVRKMPCSAAVYKSRTIGFWYFGFLPNDVLWFYLCKVFLSSSFVVHAIRTGYFFRLASSIFHRHSKTYSFPAIWVDQEEGASNYDPEESRGLPGFGFERILRDEDWLVCLYAFVLNVTVERAAVYDKTSATDSFESVLRSFWQSSGIPSMELSVLDKLHHTIASNDPLIEGFASFFTGQDQSRLKICFETLEETYWSLVSSCREYENDVLIRSALHRYYVHGYL